MHSTVEHCNYLSIQLLHINCHHS